MLDLEVGKIARLEQLLRVPGRVPHATVRVKQYGGARTLAVYRTDASGFNGFIADLYISDTTQPSEYVVAMKLLGDTNIYPKIKEV